MARGRYTLSGLVDCQRFSTDLNYFTLTNLNCIFLAYRDEYKCWRNPYKYCDMWCSARLVSQVNVTLNMVFLKEVFSALFSFHCMCSATLLRIILSDISAACIRKNVLERHEHKERSYMWN